MDLVKLRLMLCCNLKPGIIMKKTLFTLGLAIAATLTLTNCAKQEAILKDAEPAKQGVPFELVAGMDTKTTAESLSSIKWAANDAIAVFHTAAGSDTYETNDKFTIAEEDLASNTFKGTVTGDFEASNDWFAFYPYSEYMNPSGSGYMAVGGDMTQDFAHPMAHLAGSKFPLYGKAEGVANGTAPSITMNQAMSIVKVHVTNDSGAPVDVKSVTFATEDYDITGQFYINFSGATPLFSPKSGKTGKSVTLTVTNTTPIADGASADYYIAVPPFDAVIGKKLTLTVNDLSKGITLPAAVSFVPGKVKTVNFSYDAVPPIYSTEFNYPIDGSSYTSATPIQGTDSEGTSWYITYGNWNGSNCAQLRVYSAGNFGAIYNGFDCSYVTSVSYDAKVSNTNLKLNTYYSTDSGTNWVKVDDKKSLTTSFAKYSFVVSSTGEFSKVRIKFEAAGTKPSSGNYQLTIDNVEIYGNGAILPNPSITADNITGIPALGVTGESATYAIHNFSGADDIVAEGDGAVVTAASADNNGNITFTVAPNYNTSSRSSGTITLTSASESVSKVITVTQLGETFSASAETVTIPQDATSATFTITSPTFGWNATVNQAAEKNLTMSAPTSGSGSASAQTLTVNSTTNATSSEQTLGTIVVYRNGNTSDSQAKTITIKKASNVVASTYTKVTSISNGTYLICNATAARVINGVGDYFPTASVSISDGTTIIGNDTLSDCEFTITALTGGDTGKYSIEFNGKYVSWKSSTKVEQADELTGKGKWTISIDANGLATIQTDDSTAGKYRYWGWYGSSNQFRAYQYDTTAANPSYGNLPFPTLFKKN